MPEKLTQTHIVCPYFKKVENLAVCICPNGYEEQDNMICIENPISVSELVYSSNYTFVMIVGMMLLAVFIKTVTSMSQDSKEQNTFLTSNSESEANFTPEDVRRSSSASNQIQTRTCCFCWKYTKPSYQYRKRRRFRHLEQSLYVLGKTQAQAHA